MSKCGCKCQVYSRCCGYYRPVEQWNKGKREEFNERKHFNVAGGPPAKKVIVDTSQ